MISLEMLGGGYQKQKPQGDELVWLADYLDKVHMDGQHW